MKRPRAPIACFRCHHKKVRCDGAHPFCTRCQSTGSSCSYPSSRRSRNTQPHHVDPYIDHLSQLEHQIRQIEVDMNSYRSMLFSTLITPTSSGSNDTITGDGGHPQEDILRSHLAKTEQEVQESRTILAQLRLRGEQRIARTKRNQTKEAKQKQQQQQQRTTGYPNNNKKKTMRTRPSSKSESPTDLSKFLGQQSLYESSSAGRSAPTDLTTSLQHVPSFLSSSTELYGSQPTTSYPQSSASNDLYYMSGGSRCYYDPMIEYPWTTPTDFAAGNVKTEVKEKQDEMWTKTGINESTHAETAHYSPSTVAAIEEVTRLAQQMNPQQQ